MSSSVVPADPHLLLRFRSAGASIAWRTAAASNLGATARTAHLHDEEAVVEERVGPSGVTLVTDAGPVGALVLLLEIDRRGETPLLASLPAGSDAGFVRGGICARWPGGSNPPPRSIALPMADLIALARYALV